MRKATPIAASGSMSWSHSNPEILKRVWYGLVSGSRQLTSVNPEVLARAGFWAHISGLASGVMQRHMAGFAAKPPPVARAVGFPVRMSGNLPGTSLA